MKHPSHIPPRPSHISPRRSCIPPRHVVLLDEGHGFVVKPPSKPLELLVNSTLRCVSYLLVQSTKRMAKRTVSRRIDRRIGAAAKPLHGNHLEA